jgi:CarD family transcriptional regulator
VKEVLGERREYLTIKILHNDMTVMVPTANAARAGLRRVIDEDPVKKVLAVLQDECSEMPKNWNRRFKHNRDKIKTGDVYELAEVVRNLAIREAEKGLSTGEKQMFTRARKILASELMYALEMTAEQVELHLDSLLLDSSGPAGRTLASNGKVATADAKLQGAPGKPGAGGVATNGKVAAAAGGLPSLDGDLALSPE